MWENWKYMVFHWDLDLHYKANNSNDNLCQLQCQPSEVFNSEQLPPCCSQQLHFQLNPLSTSSCCSLPQGQNSRGPKNKHPSNFYFFYVGSITVKVILFYSRETKLYLFKVFLWRNTNSAHADAIHTCKDWFIFYSNLLHIILWGFGRVPTVLQLVIILLFMMLLDKYWQNSSSMH